MKNKAGIFSILDSPALGGGEKYLLSNLEFLSRQNFTITLATYNQEIKDQYSEKFNLVNLPYRLDLIGNKRGVLKFFLQAPLAALWLIKVLLKLKKKYSPLIIYTPGFTERLFFSPFIKLLGLKLIWLEYGPVSAVFKRHWGLPKLLYLLTCQLPDKIITISAHTQKSLLDNTFIKKSDLSLIYPGVTQISEDQLNKILLKGRSWKKQHQLSSKMIVTFVGRLATEKKGALLIKAFAKLTINNAHLVIIGTGPAQKDWQKMVSDLNLSDRVSFTGYLTEVQKNIILAVSDIFVFPSAWEMEGFGIATIEAMMMGSAVISTGSGPQKEIIKNKQNGLFFEKNNCLDLKIKMEQLLRNKKLNKKLATNGRKKASAQFTQALMQQKTLKLIQSSCD